MKLIIAVCVALLSFNVCAEKPYEIGVITKLVVHSDPDDSSDSGQRFTVSLDDIAANNPCGEDSWTGHIQSEAGKAQYAALLAATMAGRRVRLDGTENRCESGKLLVRNVYIADENL